MFWLGYAACMGRPAEPVQRESVVVADSVVPKINPSGTTIETRFPVPVGFVRMPTDSGTFGAYLRCLPLLPDGEPVLLYNGRKKNRQDVHCAVIDIDVGSRDLQQCADAVMRLRAEYLYAQRRFDNIHFNFSNGFRADYARWRKGERIRVDGNRVYWVAGQNPAESRAGFQAYLDMVFAYAGSASLERELTVADITNIRPGDIWIEGGYPGHAVIVVDVAVHPESGERQFLLAQSYMPAQQIHILRNPGDAEKSPWYSTEGLEGGLVTPEWSFDSYRLRRFPS